MRKLNLLVICLTSLVLAGCARYIAQNQPTTASNQPAPSATTVEQSILNAGSKLGWQMKVTNPGLIEGDYFKGKQHAIVTVAYNTQSYSIDYNHSKNLGSTKNAADIYKTYSVWIKQLNCAIQANLKTAREQAAAARKAQGTAAKQSTPAPKMASTTSSNSKSSSTAYKKVTK